MSVENNQADAGRDGRTCLARPNSQTRTKTGNIYLPCLAGHNQDWTPTAPVDAQFAELDGHTYIIHMEMSRLMRDGTAEPVSRDQILRHARGQGNVHFPCSADHEQDWQPYPVDPYSAICDDHTYIHTYIHTEPT